MNTFSKTEKICSTLRIQSLCRQGKHFVAWPLRVSYRVQENRTQVLIWAPKSLFKRAVDRNRLRRLMREAYRLNKGLLPEDGPCYEIAFHYMDKQMVSYECICKAMVKALKKIQA